MAPRMSQAERKWIMDELRKRAYAFSTSSSGDRLGQLVRRAEIGLISYEKRTINELRQFCTARKLSVSKSSGRLQLIAILEHADDNAQFEGFSDLPAELRVRIYEIHFRDTSNLSFSPIAEPPITRASRLLRKESAHVFYDMTRFRIALSRETRWAPEGFAVARFQTRAPEAAVSKVKKIFIGGAVVLPWTRNNFRYWTWEIDLANKDKQAIVRRVRQISDNDVPPNPGLHDELESRLGRTEEIFTSILGKMAARKGVTSLTREDVMAFEFAYRRFDQGLW